VRSFGAAGKTIRYPGLKEELYLSEFVPDIGFARAVALPEERPLVVVRPPGYWADYYRGRGDLFRLVLGHVLADASAFIVFLPRVSDQAAALREVSPTRLLVPSAALDGPNLVYHADLVVSAGGTMNREAAILGTPAYTVFEGLLGAVDKALVAQGRMHVLRNEHDVRRLRIAKKRKSQPLRHEGARLTRFVTDAILEAA
jgi:predicted glycosyltransferase